MRRASCLGLGLGLSLNAARSCRDHRLHVIALACGLLWPVPQAGAAIAVAGNFVTTPGGLLIGPGDTDLGQAHVHIGNGAPGSFSATAGSLFTSGTLSLANNGNGSAAGVVDGVGTIVSLTANGDYNRFEVGNWGVGSFTVSGGALLDGRANAAACLEGNRFCNNFIGNGAGSDGTFTVTGAGSTAQFVHRFSVGGVSVFRQPLDAFNFGTRGGTTQGRVNVLAGGTLLTGSAAIGRRPGGGSPTGRERSFADVVIDGAGSVWRVTGGSAADPHSAVMFLSDGANAWATMTIRNGGKLQFDVAPGFVNGVNLTQDNGRSDTLVTGSGSAIDANGGVVQVGMRLGTGTLTVNDGARVNDVYYFSVGRDGSFGTLVLDGAGSAITINKAGALNTADAGFQGGMQIGRNGTGVATVSNGARIDIVSTTGRDRARYLELGVGAASSGTLNIDGVGSEVRISVASLVPGGGPTESFSAYAAVGAQGGGTLNITRGGKLVLEGNVVSTEADRRSTAVSIGGGGDTTVGARGIAVVRGVGSEIAVNGTDRFIGVGRGPSSFGELTVADGGRVSSSIVNVGRFGATGILNIDGGTVALTGQYSLDPVATGINMGLAAGSGDGTGIVRMSNGAVLSISNNGSASSNLTLGGTTVNPGGDGSLTMTGGSSINITSGQTRSQVTVGNDGTGLLRMSGASSIALVGDSRFVVARLPGSDGTVIATGGSTISADWVGIGRRPTDTGDVDGGTGTMVLNGATLTASTIVIGSNGFLGGTAGSIVGNVTNYGTFSPGASPGRFDISGSFTAVAGSRLILEVESDGAGGFRMDEVVFAPGTAIDLNGVGIEFRFLGATDPNAFQATGQFDIDTFLKQDNGAGGFTPLPDAVLEDAVYRARAERFVITGFTYTPQGGAQFTAAVPEPQTYALFGCGLLVLAWAARRRARDRSCSRSPIL